MKKLAISLLVFFAASVLGGCGYDDPKYKVPTTSPVKPWKKPTREEIEGGQGFEIDPNAAPDEAEGTDDGAAAATEEKTAPEGTKTP